MLKRICLWLAFLSYVGDAFRPIMTPLRIVRNSQSLKLSSIIGGVDEDSAVVANIAVEGSVAAIDDVPAADSIALSVVSASIKEASTVSEVKYKVGSQLKGSLLHVAKKGRGIFVGIGKDKDTKILIRKKEMSKGTYLKLVAQLNEKQLSPDERNVNVEVTNIDRGAGEHHTDRLYGKFIPSSIVEDITKLNEKQLQSSVGGKNEFAATVISVHDYGIFAELDRYGVEGLIPSFRLEKGEKKLAFKPGDPVTVKINKLPDLDVRMVLSIVGVEDDGISIPPAMEALSQNPEKWMNGIIQNVAPFGLFVRIADQDFVGMVHHSRIPVPLLRTLKRRIERENVESTSNSTANSGVNSDSDSDDSDSTNKNKKNKKGVNVNAAASNQTDIEICFKAGDVIKCRIHSINPDGKKVDLSLLPYKNLADEQDGYIVEGRDADPTKAAFQDTRDLGKNKNDKKYNVEDLIVWWRGASYKKALTSTDTDTLVVGDPEVDFIHESPSMVDGAWRRMFELDMRKDAEDFNSKSADFDEREIADEIGSLKGLDEEIIDTLGLGSYTNTIYLGNAIDKTSLPPEWLEELTFYKEREAREDVRISFLRNGKTAEQTELDSLLRAIQLNQVAGKKSKRRGREREGDRDNSRISVKEWKSSRAQEKVHQEQHEKEEQKEDATA